MERDKSINARLPESLEASPSCDKDLEESPRSELKVGEIGWTFPEQMQVDTDRRCWLLVDLELKDQASGVYPMFVERVEGGFVVGIGSVPAEDYPWEMEDALPASAFDNEDPENPEWLPVVKIFHSASNASIDQELPREAVLVTNEPLSSGRLRRLSQRVLDSLMGPY